MVGQAGPASVNDDCPFDLGALIGRADDTLDSARELGRCASKNEVPRL